MKKNAAFYMLSVERTGWHIACYTRKAAVGENFLELFKISDEDRVFIENNIKESRRELFLLKGEKNSVFLSTHLYFSSGLIFAAIFDEYIGFMTTLADRGELTEIIKAPSCESVENMKRLSREKSENVKEVFGSLRGLVGGTALLHEANAFSLMLMITEKAEIFARLAGCAVEIENRGVFGEVENYDIAMASAFIIASAVYLKRAGITRTGTLAFSSVGEKLYISFECESYPDTETFEFDVLRFCADELEIGFFVIEEKGKTCVHLCSHRPDLSKLGLKNDIFLR